MKEEYMKLYLLLSNHVDQAATCPSLFSLLQVRKKARVARANSNSDNGGAPIAEQKKSTINILKYAYMRYIVIKIIFSAFERWNEY
eukprot:scaffold50111_cov40-Attheya_sp.AAC.2